MNFTPTIVQPGLVLTTVSQAIVPASGQRVVLRAVAFCNTGASGIQLTVALVRADGSMHPVIQNRPLQTGETFVSRELPNQMLAVGDSLVGQASSAGAISVIATGLGF